jgi:predicted lysophospholipase L1 biosynthesis ABC-type transport system permease subunit
MDIKKLAELGGGGGTSTLQVQKQIKLPVSEAVRISIKNVVLRLGRAAITATGIVLGVAFLMYILSDRLFTDGAYQAQEYLEQAREQQITEAGAGRGGETVAAGETSAAAAEATGPTREERAAKQTWLVVMSLLVCGIGITNAMLMSVTERFREIGTMKCLGALDWFIVELFLIESIVIGTLGSAAGIVVGFGAAFLVSLFRDGSGAWGFVSWGDMGLYIAFSLVVGAFLSFLSAIVPSLNAARMPPAAALRTEI